MEGQGPRATLLEALQALYHHPDPQIRNAANQWLEEFQTTMEAWQVRRNWCGDFRFFFCFLCSDSPLDCLSLC
jgi:transportin-3